MADLLSKEVKMSFTKSTTDIVVHQKLGDNPNIDDGKTAAQLKEMFDFPAETLQDDLNNHIDELGEEYAASLIGATSLSEGDTTDGNIQAKLGYLQEEIEGVSQGAVADGSITQAKMDTTYEATIAKKNNTLQTGLNAEKLGGYTLAQVLEYMTPETGLYTGNGATGGQVIELDFTPSAVIIQNSKDLYNQNYGFSSKQGMAFTSTPYVYNSTNLIEIVEDGFKVKNAPSGGAGYGNYGFNENNKGYNYVAFK